MQLKLNSDLWFLVMSGFDMGDLSEERSSDDFEGLDASAAHIANLLSTEPAGSKTFMHTLKYMIIIFMLCIGIRE